MGELDTYRREVGGSIRLGKVGRAHLQPRSLPRLDYLLDVPYHLYVGMTALTAHIPRPCFIFFSCDCATAGQARVWCCPTCPVYLPTYKGEYRISRWNLHAHC